MRKLLLFAIAVALSRVAAMATDIEGVQPAALDQPRINMCLKRDPKGNALSAKALTGDESTINIQAFLDTGASGIMLSGKTASALGVKHLTAGAKDKPTPVVFHDVGVGGGDAFDVSEELFICVAPYKSSSEPSDQSEYPIGVGPVRTQISSGGGLIEMLTGGLDVLGMPAIKGRIVIMDPKPVDKFDDTMRCGLFERGKAQVPKTDRHVKLTYVDFKPFTKLDPPNAQWPAFAANPMIGPSPLAKDAAAKTPAVIITYNGRKISGTFLLDTGAAASMISTDLAAALGVTYAKGTQGTDGARLEAVAADKQFTLAIGGVGGTKNAAGFFLDTLVIPTREGDPLIYKPAPVLVNDITIEDPKTKQKLTIDGVLGMNFLVASAHVTIAGLMPDITNMTAGPFEWIVIDEPQGILGLKLKK